MAITRADRARTPQPASCLVRVTPPMPVVGQLVRLEATFTVNGEPYDPRRVIGRLRSSAGTLQIAANRVGEGVFHLTLRPNEPGMWQWRVEGAGGEGVAEGEVNVRASLF